MKNRFLLAVWAIVFMMIQALTNCSDPLEGTENGGPIPSAPVDTVVLVDTLEITDTLIITQPGPGGSETVCSRIASNQTEIVWMFRNQAGSFVLEFTAALEREHPDQILSVDIAGQEYQWHPAASPEYVTDLFLEQNAMIRITTKKPPSLGHTIHICLTIRQ